MNFQIYYDIQLGFRNFELWMIRVYLISKNKQIIITNKIILDFIY
jgi:hypothetical protein